MSLKKKKLVCLFIAVLAGGVVSAQVEAVRPAFGEPLPSGEGILWRDISGVLPRHIVMRSTPVHGRN